MARRVEQVRFRVPQSGDAKLHVFFTDSTMLTLKSGEIQPQLKKLARDEKYGKIKAFLIYEMAYDRAMSSRNGPSLEIQDLLYEIHEAVESLGYKPGILKKKHKRPAKS